MSEDISNKDIITVEDQSEEKQLVVEESAQALETSEQQVEESATTEQTPIEIDDAEKDTEHQEDEKEQQHQSEQQQEDQQSEQVQDVGNDLIQEDPHTSFLQPPASEKQFTTPSKDLPALKDIEPITTPKTFAVAKDAIEDQENLHGDGDTNNNNNHNSHDDSTPIVASSPMKHNILADLEMHNEDTIDEDSLRAISGYLSLDESSIRSINNSSVLQALVSKSVEFQNITSENEFLKLKLEQNAQSIGKQLDDLKQKYSQSDNLATILKDEKEKLELNYKQQQQEFANLKEGKDNIERELLQLKTSESAKDEELNKLRDAQGQFEMDFEQQINQLSSTNITQSKKLNELTKEINETRNDKFTLQLDLTKAQNEISYLRDQKEWFENELKSAQSRFTDLIKKHESEYISTTSNVSNFQIRNETLEKLKQQLESTVDDLKSKLEQEITKSSKTESEFELEKSRFLKEITSKEELIELTKLQSEQRASRIEQLESYIEEVKDSMGETIASLESRLSEETEKLMKVEEKLRRTEEVLDAELHKETDLPKLSDSSAMIAANGISLSTLYSEYNHLKKQLVLERSQKQKMEIQLESFIAELDARKPAIANYREQIQFYENSMKEMIGKVETIRSEKTEVEKDAKRLRTVINENEIELVSLKKLLKDLGRQLCFYLIHSKIRDNNENPLTASEKRAIEKILDQSGRSDEQESDSDKLITERLLEFKNIIELRQKNEELLVAIRNLSRKLESREDENNNLESVAIEEAKEAILTLESELDSLNIKLDAITKERDALRSINGKTATSNTNNNYLVQINEDLKKKVDDCESIISKLREQSSKTVVDLNEKLRVITDQKNELSLKVSVSDKSAELANSRLSIVQKSFEDSRQELDQVRKEINFWKQQTSKLEASLITKSEQLHQLEETLSSNKIAVASLEREREFKNVIQDSLQNEVNTLKQDKTKLNEFVLNLQSMLKEREESAKEISSKLNASIDNYQSLHKKLSEKEERIFILSNQSELSLKAQNAKLEQVNEISRQLLETKNMLVEKENLVEELKKKLSSKRDIVVAPVATGVPAGGSTASNNESNNNNLEIQQLKEDLRIAESQVDELTNLAKASETTLINATTSFEQYKHDSESKYQSLIKEKESLEEEVKRVNELYQTTANNLELAKTEHLAELNNLKLQLNEFRYKSDQYDALDKDYKEKLESIRKDLQEQVKLANESHNKYLIELNKNVTLSEQISGLKDKLEVKEVEIKNLAEEVKITKKSVEEQKDKLAVEKSQIETDLSMSNNKISELKEQNDLLLNQLELTKQSVNGGSTGSENVDDLRQVINYLRREKDSSDAKLLVATHENQELKIRLTNVENQIAATSSTFNNSTSVINLDAKVQEQKELSSQLEQMNILKESNNNLRQENSKLVEEIGKLHSEVDNLRKELDPLKATNNKLTTELEFAEQKVKLIEEENQRIKTSATSTDEEKVEEAKKLHDSVQKMQEQMSRLKEKANQRVLEKLAIITEKDANIQELNKKIQELNNKIEELGKSTKVSDESKDQINKSKEQIDELNKKLTSVSEDLKKVVQEKNDLIKKLSDLESNLRNQFEKEKQELSKTLQSSKGSDSTVNKDLQENYNSLLDRFVQEKKQFESELETTKAKTREEVEKKYELKLKMLTRKVDKYEKAMKNTTPATVPAKPPIAAGTPTLATPGQASSGLVTASTPAAKSTSGSPILAGKPVARPVGHPGNESTLTVHRPGPTHPFNESTLTVHRPAVSKTEPKKFSPSPNVSNTGGNGQQESRKRTNENQQHRPQVKKAKD